MAYEWGPRHVESYPAAADLSTKQFFIGQFGTGRTIALAGAGAGHGVIDNAPVAGETTALVTNGVTKVKCGGTITAGDPLICNATGEAITATQETSEGYIFGTAREDGAAGTVIAALVDFSRATWSSVDAIA